MVPWPRIFLGFLILIGFIGLFFIFWFYFSIYLGVQLSRSGGIIFLLFSFFFLPLSVLLII